MSVPLPAVVFVDASKVRPFPTLTSLPSHTAMLLALYAASPCLAEPVQFTQLARGDAAPPPISMAEFESAGLEESPAGERSAPVADTVTPQQQSDRQNSQVLRKTHPENADELRVIQAQIQSVVQVALPATLGVELSEWSGSGVLVSADGLVLTAGHVVGKPDQRAEFILPDGRKAVGRMLGINRRIDCGMMRITEPAGPWPFVRLAEPGRLRPGDWVIATGQPGGYEAGRTPPVRLGRVLFMGDELINTDCTLVGGDSGGPLLDIEGRLVGIHSRIGEQVTSNFHVPIEAYQADWERLLAGEMWGGPLDAVELDADRPLLGLAGHTQPDGCRVTQVFPDRPAALAGVQIGDVVRKVGDRPVQSCLELSRLILSRRPGETVGLELRRGAKLLNLRVRLGGIGRTLPGGAPRPERADREG